MFVPVLNVILFMFFSRPNVLKQKAENVPTDNFKTKRYK